LHNTKIIAVGCFLYKNQAYFKVVLPRFLKVFSKSFGGVPISLVSKGSETKAYWKENSSGESYKCIIDLL